MASYTILLPDIGEGIAEAELSEWNVKIGDLVREDDILAVVMTDKAAVEVPSAVSGKVTWLAGEAGDAIAVGAPLVKLEVAEEVAAAAGQAAEKAPEPAAAAKSAVAAKRAAGVKPQAAPAVRKRAREAGVDLRDIAGTGPDNRITQRDLDDFLAKSGAKAGAGPRSADDVTEVRIIGVRRAISEKMAQSKANIPHFTIIEDVDVEALEDLRAKLNAKHKSGEANLTMLAFVMRAMVEAVRGHPEMNAHFGDGSGPLYVHSGIHIGVAVQTSAGLTVPVVRNANALTLLQVAEEVARLVAAARGGKATRDEMTGSTITITSLGKLGALASTPIINYPEVAIIGINKMAVRPVWDGKKFQPRKMMNLSCSFDHRVIDGWNAAVFVQKLKSLLEEPADLAAAD